MRRRRQLSPWPRGGLWRHGDFLRLWSAETISQFGTQITFLALPLVAILVLDASAFEVAALSTVEFLPFLLFTLLAGVWVDRLPRRPILIVADFGRAAALASVPLAAVLDVLTLAQLYAVAFLTGILTVFFDVAYQSYLPSLVGRDQLVEGNSRLETSRSVAAIGGPGFAGVLVELITAPYAILADAVSFVGSGVFVLKIRRREAPARSEDEPKTRMRAELAEGLRYVLRHPYLRPQAICTASSNFFSNVIFAIFVVYAVRELRLSPAVIGIVLGVGNVGALMGAFVAGRASRRLGVGRATIASALLFGPPTLLVPLAPQAQPIPFLVASGLISALGIVVYNITQVSLRQAITPERMQGRMNAIMRFMVWGTIPLGSLSGGALASWIGLRPTLWIGAIGSTLTFLPIVLSPLRSLRDVPEPGEVESGEQPVEPGIATVVHGPLPADDPRA